LFRTANKTFGFQTFILLPFGLGCPGLLHHFPQICPSCKAEGDSFLKHFAIYDVARPFNHLWKKLWIYAKETPGLCDFHVFVPLSMFYRAVTIIRK